MSNSVSKPIISAGQNRFKSGYIYRTSVIHPHAFFSDVNQKRNLTMMNAVNNSPNDGNYQTGQNYNNDTRIQTREITIAKDSPMYQVRTRTDDAVVEGGAMTRRFFSLHNPVPDTSTYEISIRTDDASDQHNLIFTWYDAKLLVELVAAELDTKSGDIKPTKTVEIRGEKHGDFNMFNANVELPLDFGEIGAVKIHNHHDHEIYVHDIKVTNNRDIVTGFRCESWVHSNNDSHDPRIFFAHKSYLSSQTPSGLVSERKNELSVLRGDNVEPNKERKKFERIYDYDLYNDLGDIESESRPILGGSKFPYPRRCRTGRQVKKDKDGQLVETRDDFVYVPRDESFQDKRDKSFRVNAIMTFLHSAIPTYVEPMALNDNEFAYFTEIDTLFAEEGRVKIKSELKFSNILPRIIKQIDELTEVLHFTPPELMERDRFSWLKDDEFCRQTLAGINPLSIQLVKEWPLVSKLDEKEYGSPESAITKEIVEQQINSYMKKSDTKNSYIKFDEALAEKKLFIIDYHDMFIPYVKKVRELKGTTLYGSRTLMFLKPTDELMLVAIELTRPSDDKNPQWKRVFVPGTDATSSWLWKLAKIHVLAHDSGYHQLVSHWLRTHCATEPYIIATNRCLSEMHPVYRLLHPHFRYTMEINALARNKLINAGGVIETGFFTKNYSMEISSIAYKDWRFDLEALPADLIHRGMAEEDKDAPHGLKLAIKDYPYANDGLILWDAIEEWVSSYVNHYYPDSSLLESDFEIHEWWNEIRTVGHGDKKDEHWWPSLKTQNDLIRILTTIIWVASGHHSAVNFGQYGYAGYFPNRPAIARTKMPTEDFSDGEWKQFINHPEKTLLACLPSVYEATIVMGTLALLSEHFADEEYIGELKEQAWEEDEVIKSSYEMFKAKLQFLKATISKRNADYNLKNRFGAGVIPYKLLMPDSEAGLTGQGVPNSISI